MKNHKIVNMEQPVGCTKLLNTPKTRTACDVMDEANRRYINLARLEKSEVDCLKDNLKERIKQRNEQCKARIKGRYHLARSLGLSSQEALFAQQWSERRIRAYADQKTKP